MMDLIKAIISLLTSFFNNSAVKKKEELSLVEVNEKAVVEEIRATSNAAATEQLTKMNENLAKMKKQYKKKQAEDSKKSLDEQIDDQFSKDD